CAGRCCGKGCRAGCRWCGVRRRCRCRSWSWMGSGTRWSSCGSGWCRDGCGWMCGRGRCLGRGLAPLLRVELARGGADGSWYGVLYLHHLLNDHVTLEVALAEVLSHLQGRGGEL